MQRVLDIDLDFFVEPIAYNRKREHPRLEAGDHSVWPMARAMSFLRERCLLDGPRPGFAVEHHGEVFERWRGAIDAGILEPPFHVTHVDAHADLGLGEGGWVHLLTEVPTLPLDRRPSASALRLADADFLAFAVGCRWLSDVVYVKHADVRGSDVHPHLRENFDRSSQRVRLAALTPDELAALRARRPPSVEYTEPAVVVEEVPWERFQADRQFDLVCLARSPPYTPASADVLYEEIRTTLIDELS
jgi:hypothetical protein